MPKDKVREAEERFEKAKEDLARAYREAAEETERDGSKKKSGGFWG